MGAAEEGVLSKFLHGFVAVLGAGIVACGGDDGGFEIFETLRGSFGIPGVEFFECVDC